MARLPRRLGHGDRVTLVDLDLRSASLHRFFGLDAQPGLTDVALGDVAVDDAIVAGLVLRHVVKRAGPNVVKDHWRGDPRTLSVLLRVARGT
mgnify:CR=1 FL=1